mmetsp:Transcript_23300/g.66027  ORF Transcript_23300/g.66027 Transcript_23300/m.66027 type:complete len:840 (-) Transcript_23300:132-2651(-)
MDKEVSCLNLNPFTATQTGSSGASASASASANQPDDMDVDGASDSKPGSANRGNFVAVGLWDDFTVRLLSLEASLHELLAIHLDVEEYDEDGSNQESVEAQRRNRNNMMARSLCLISLDFSSSPSSSGGQSSSSNRSRSSHHTHQNQSAGVDMLLVGLGDGTLISFAVVQPSDGRPVRVQSRKEVSLGSQRINLIPLRTERGGTCVLATGDRPTVIYLAGISGTATSSSTNFNPKLCYSNVNLSTDENEIGAEGGDVTQPHGHQTIAVNVAAPFFSPLLFDHSVGSGHYSLCVADDSNLRLGVIDDIQKLHITTCRLGMAPRRVAYCPEGRLFAVGCIESGIKQPGMGGGDINMANCIRFIDDITFEDIERIDLDAFEMIMSMTHATLNVRDPMAVGGGSGGASDPMKSSEVKKYLLIGTAYALPDEDEPTRGRIMVISCSPENGPNAVATGAVREIRIVAEHQVRGGVYSIAQFFEGRFMVSVNSKTQLLQLISDGKGNNRLEIVGMGHHGHIVSLFLKSRADNLPSRPAKTKSSNEMKADGSNSNRRDDKEAAPETEQLAIIGDLMKSISLVRYYPEHETLEEVARDFNANWTTAIEMLTDDVYLGGEATNNLFVLRRNKGAQNEDVRCRLDTIGEIHLGEMCNKFMCGSLVMPQTAGSGSGDSASSTAGRRRSIASGKKASENSKVSALVTARSRRPTVVIGSQTIFGTVDGTLGCILGLDGPTAAFFACLERSMQRIIKPIGGFSHQHFRAITDDKRHYPSHGFVDGDMIESFMDLDGPIMQRVVMQMNRDGGWELEDPMMNPSADASSDMNDDMRPELAVDDVLALVEEIAMLH